VTDQNPAENPFGDDFGWTAYIEATADREEPEHFLRCIDIVDGEDGTGRTVVDYGFGGGAQTRSFLRRGWTVFAVDVTPGAAAALLSRTPPDLRDRLTVEIGAFHEVDLPPTDLVYASFSLPFAGQALDAAVANAFAALTPEGVFFGNFFGHNDEWARDPILRTVDRTWIDRTFAEFSEVTVTETDADGPFGLEGDTKHWHFYFVEARR